MAVGAPRALEASRQVLVVWLAVGTVAVKSAWSHPAGRDAMTLWRSGTRGAVSGMVARRWITAVDAHAALMGGFAALGVFAFAGVVLTLGDPGVFDLDELERLAFPTVAFTIIVVFVAFFCGGWVHGMLRRRVELSPPPDGGRA